MFSLKLYMRNSLNESPTEYIIQNLEFQDAYIGRRRDEKNLLIIRKFVEGGIIIKNPADFDALSDYIYSPQDGSFTVDSVNYQCLVKFSDPNYTTKQLRLSIDLIDDYSELIDGAIWNSWGSSQVPTISKEYTKTELDNIQPDSLTEYFADGSQYMYDAEVPGSELWGTETESFTQSFDAYYVDTLLFNTGGEGNNGTEITIALLIPKVEYLEEHYKPTYIKWSNSTGTGSNITFQTVQVDYEREFRYFAEQEKAPDSWELTNGTRTKNGFTYYKHVRPLYEDQTYLSGDDIYFIRDEQSGSDYVTAEFRGINTELQKSSYFYKLRDLIERLIEISTQPLYSYNTIVPHDYYVSNLKNYNGINTGINLFKLEPFINSLRDKFRIYFEIDTNVATFKYLNFNTKLLDIDNYRSEDFIPDIQVTINETAREYEINTNAWQLDFKKQTVSFYGKSNIKEQVSYALSTDLEDTSKNEDQFILIKTKQEFQDQIYEKFALFGNNNGTEALHVTPDGKFISWDTDELDLATYLEFELYSNKIYLDIDDEIIISYGVEVSVGIVTVEVGGYSASHGPSSTTVYTTTTLSGSRIEYARISLNSAAAKGFLYNFKIEVKTLLPEIKTGKISNRSLKNGELSSAYTIIENKPLMSYPGGYLENYGTIDCNTKYSKDIEFPIALDYDLYDYDINHYLELDSEKYIIFEEKRQMLDENTLSNITQIKAKSNEIY